MWEHWGTLRPLRLVQVLASAEDKRLRRSARYYVASTPSAVCLLHNGGSARFAVRFQSADWIPWRAIAQLRRDWPELVLVVRPQYDRGEARETADGGGQGPDPLWDDWGTPPRVPPSPELHLDGFDGPLDLLLDLVECKRIDLRRMRRVSWSSSLRRRWTATPRTWRWSVEPTGW